jgi:hypothetical protein
MILQIKPWRGETDHMTDLQIPVEINGFSTHPVAKIMRFAIMSKTPVSRHVQPFRIPSTK